MTRLGVIAWVLLSTSVLGVSDHSRAGSAFGWGVAPCGLLSSSKESDLDGTVRAAVTNWIWGQWSERNAHLFRQGDAMRDLSHFSVNQSDALFQQVISGCEAKPDLHVANVADQIFLLLPKLEK